MDGMPIQFQISKGSIYVLDSTGAMWFRRMSTPTMPEGEWARMNMPGDRERKPKTAFDALLIEQERLRKQRSDSNVVDQEP